MRVLYIQRYFPTLTETFVNHELEGVLAAGDEVVVARLGSREDGHLVEEPPAVEVLDVPRRSLAGVLSRRTAGERWLLQHQRPKDVARLAWLRARLAGIEHVHVHFAGEAAEWAHALHLDTGLSYSVMVHAVDLFKPRASLREVLSGASRVLAVAEFHVAHLAALGIPAELCRCGPRLADWAGLPAPAEGPLRALFVGRDVPKKGLPILLAAWERGLEQGRLGPGARLDLVGVERTRTPRGVHSHGLCPVSEVRARLSEANLVVLPCRRAEDGDLDGVPVVLMEALAARRPVIAGDVSGVPELVDEAVGWLVPSDDVGALVDVLDAACEAAERQRRGARGPGRLRERGFTLEAQVATVRAAWRTP